MATPSSAGDNPPNHRTSSTSGGASAVPTPANNSGGGRGWGDKGFFKGGSEGPGHVAVSDMDKPKSTMGDFLGLSSQKGAASDHFHTRVEGASEMGDRGSCQTEDHSFMEHRPACPKTLPGWSKTKEVLNT
ncbi:uncharacterized protein ACLA_083380 [Aspergillus clavatus NRRL 1]|uniref:Uncharacterized protein n=1 Tax=Aspergillus clavatus (strain ATCC 1007 / CBS 513.65 / DSM 816 / NCTC 3887 / NRRL 1 / QM 1276 / 107) TaxID=344612 RepID=A1CTK6_ASPCL|nr:uncharacterized protein ACLA_083380 [Aspergillus clavatus NRRL 1]EAW06643.1 conserved hypothetical protein [Aspergillus clavatus NRRL 1]